MCRVAGYFSPTLKEPLFISLLAFPFPSSCSKARGEMVSSVFMCVLLVRCIRGGRRGEVFQEPEGVEEGEAAVELDSTIFSSW